VALVAFGFSSTSTGRLQGVGGVGLFLILVEYMLYRMYTGA
jgi:hypothetical protein